MTVSLSTGDRTADDLLGLIIGLVVLGVALVLLQAWEMTRRGKR